MDPGLVNAVTWKIPNALALVGSRSGDEWNAMTTSWISQVSMEPVLIAVGVDISAVTHRLISAGGAFTVNLWSADDVRTFVKFSKPARRERSENGGWELNGRRVHEAPSGVPVFEEAVAWMDCAVRHNYDLGTHTLFVGEITAAALNDDQARVAAMSDTRMKYGGTKRH